MEALNHFLTRSESSRLKIAVVGDAMIDEYYAVKVNRVSPEFPIPVLLSEDDKPISVVPGGAANVCLQMKHWNVDTYLLTAMTSSSEKVFGAHNFNCEYSATMINGWKTPRKKRFYDGDFPLDRWDVETKNAAKTNTQEWSRARRSILNNFTTLVKHVQPDIVILSDYGKGVFVGGAENISQMLIDYCNRKNIPVIVDPKTVSSEFWSGCSVIKPNAGWARAFCDKYAEHLDTLEDMTEYISQALFTQEVVLTDSGNGVCIHDRNKEETDFYPSPFLSKKRPIIRSVIGAGDCFCAFFAMAKALGLPLKEAVLVAFNGASAYIEDKHNNPVTPHQFQKWFDPVGAKRVSLDKLLKIKNQMPKQTWVWTNGCFDIMHAGHLKTFEEARKLGDKVVVGLNTDDSVKMLKGDSRPILPYNQREALVSHLQYVDFVVPISEKKPDSIIRQLVPDRIVKGGDYNVEEISGWDIVGKDNVYLVPLEEDVSTSKIIERIRNG